jgi:hypothetical protein
MVKRILFLFFKPIKLIGKIHLDCCPDIFVDLKFNITLERRGGFYNYILILPCVLLSCLTCILFWLPVGEMINKSFKEISDLFFFFSSRKVHRRIELIFIAKLSIQSIGMNIFTSFFVLLLLLYKNMPSNAEHIPRIGTEMKSSRLTKHFLLLLFRRVLLFKYGNDRDINIPMYNRCSYLLPRQWTHSNNFTQS